jgi:hypothetical protein
MEAFKNDQRGRMRLGVIQQLEPGQVSLVADAQVFALSYRQMKLLGTVCTAEWDFFP